MIAQYFQQNYHRRLIIPGAIKLKLFPLVHLETGEISLSEKDSDAIFAKIKSANLSLMLLPLIDRKLDVKNVAINGLDVQLTRYKDGTTNGDDLFSAGTGGQTDFDIQALKLNGSLRFDDQASDRHLQLRDIKLTTSHLANGIPGEVKIAAQMAMDKPAIGGQIALAGDVLFDMAQKKIASKQWVADFDGHVENWRDVIVKATGAAEFEGANSSGLLRGLALNAAAKHEQEIWVAKFLLPESKFIGTDIEAKNITTTIDLQRPGETLNTTLETPSLRYMEGQWQADKLRANALLKRGADSVNASASVGTAHISGRQWHANDVLANGRWSKKSDFVEAKLMAANFTGDDKTVRPQTLQLDANGLIGKQPMSLRAIGDIEIINGFIYVI